MNGKPETPAAKRGIHKLSARQHGLITRAQLLAAGLSAHAVGGRVRRGRLIPIQRGVYRVGAASPREREMAAVLCTPESVVSHRSAASLWRMLPEPATVEVIVVRDHGNRPGIRPHRAALDPDEATVLDRIPVTTPARTLLDLAGVVGQRELEQAMGQATKGSLAFADLPDLMIRRPSRPGASMLRKLLEVPGRPPTTRSEAEERLLHLVRLARLPAPKVNAKLAGYEVDFLWRSKRLVVEVDGYAYHSSRAQFDSDRQRDSTLVATGFTVMRVTWRQIADEPEAMVARIAQALVSSALRAR